MSSRTTISLKHVEYADTQEFWDKISPHLFKEVAVNNLLLGLAQSFITQPENCLYQGALFSDDAFLAALICSKHQSNLNLIFSPLVRSDHAEVLLRSFLAKSIRANCLFGEAQTARTYSQLFSNYGQNFKVLMNQAIFRCRHVRQPICPPDIRFRMADKRDVAFIAHAIVDFHKEAVPHDPPVDGQQFAEFRIKNKMLYLLERNGQTLSLASWARDIGTSCSVNYVYTPMDLRGNGYGSLVTALLTQLLLDQGKSEVSLYTDLTNPTSNKIYQNIGYEKVCESLHLGRM